MNNILEFPRSEIIWKQYFHNFDKFALLDELDVFRNNRSTYNRRKARALLEYIIETSITSGLRKACMKALNTL